MILLLHCLCIHDHGLLIRLLLLRVFELHYLSNSYEVSSQIERTIREIGDSGILDLTGAAQEQRIPAHRSTCLANISCRYLRLSLERVSQ